MEILKPITEEPVVQTQAEPQPEVADAPFTQNEIDVIKYLNITDKIFDEATMKKVREITEYYKTGDIEALDIKLGNPYGMERIDKIYAYMRLSKQADDLRNREQAIEQAKNNFQINDSL